MLSKLLQLATKLHVIVPLLSLLLLNASSAGSAEIKRTVVDLTIPDVVLINQQGERVRLKTYLDSEKPVVVDFIFATCTTICPVLSAGIVNVQKRFTDENQEVQLVSITIDPENDTPKVMKKYLERYEGQSGWDFLTGSRNDIDKVMEAFDAFFYDKMDHKPLYFIRTPKTDKWIRIEGFVSGKKLMKEINRG